MTWDSTKVDNKPEDLENGILNASDWNDMVTNVKARILHSLSTAENDVLVGSGSNSFIKKTLAEFKAILGLGDAAYKNVGTTSGTIAAGDDLRLSNSREPTSHNSTHFLIGIDPIIYSDIGAAPTSHNHAESDITNLTTDLSNKSDVSHLHTGVYEPVISTKNSAFNVNFGTTSGTATEGNDSRLSNNRYPTSHNSSHFPTGSDPINASDIGAAPTSHTHSESDITNLVTDLSGKEPTITKLTAFNKNYETSTDNIKMNGVVSIGSLDTLAHSDHIHPVDTSREPANANIQSHISSTSNPHGVTATQVGLSNVLNLAQLPATYLDTSTSLGTSDVKVPSQNAVKVYSDVYKPRRYQHFKFTNAYNSSDAPRDWVSASYDGTVTATSANGDYYIGYVYSYSGDTILFVQMRKAPTFGIFDLYINSELDSSGYDLYIATAVDSMQKITLTKTLVSGWNEIKLVINGKNASSSNYGLGCYGMRLR